ncbi:MAG: DoxX family membrane protein [Candidatus Kapabacteria bacterium]|nr:DoxX family membrane protein [Candidatus Kapabacteria bacterium]
MSIPAHLLGRIFLAIPFLVFGILHLMGADQMAGMVPKWVPGGVFWVYFTGIAEIAAGGAFLTGKKVKLAGQLAALLVLVYVLTIHLPGMMGATDAAAGQMSMMALLKDLGLVGGALLASHSASE